MAEFFQPIDVFGANDAAAQSYAMPGLLQSRQQGMDIGNAEALQKMQFAQQEQQEAQSQQALFHDAVVAHAAKPTLEGARNLMLQFPQFKEVTAANYKGLGSEQRTQTLTQMTAIANRAEAGDVQGAIKLLEQRRDADAAAGQDTSGEESLIAELQNPSEERRKMAVAHMYQQMAAILPEDYAATLNATKPQVVGEGSALVGNGGQVQYQQPKTEAPKYEKITNADGSQSIIQLGGGQSPTNAGTTPAAGFDAFYNGFLANAEGGYAARDGKSGAPANFGVNQGANPDIDVSKLTQQDAAKILRERYWVPSGADKVSNPALAAVIGDTAVNMGVAAAKKLAGQANGDPNKMLDLREARYREIGGPSLNGWLKRNQNLREYIAAGGQAAPAGAPAGSREVYRGAPGGQAASPKEVIALRKEFDALPEVKAFKEIAPVLVSARRAPDSAAGDIQLAYTVGKILDPNSVVREGELALAVKAGSPLERLLGSGVYTIGAGGRMTPEIRSQLLAMVNERALAVRQQYDAARDNYEGYARDMKVSPASIIGQHVANAYKTPAEIAAAKKGNRAVSGGTLSPVVNGVREWKPS